LEPPLATAFPQADQIRETNCQRRDADKIEPVRYLLRDESGANVAVQNLLSRRDNSGRIKREAAKPNCDH
jgi:hypothetical protein